MPATNRFFASTRGRMLARLLRDPMTVAELAEAFDVSNNAARQHLTALERDGYVERHRQRSTAGKPAGMYRVTPAGQALFPRAYEPVLEAFADEIAEELGREDADAFLHNVGLRLADLRPQPADATTEERIDGAIELLTELGAILDVQRFSDGAVRLDGSGCPLSGVVKGHPELCRMLATMLESLTVQPVKVLCQNEAEIPSCRFLIGAAEV